MMTLLGQDPVRCKFIVDSKCLQQVKNVKSLYCEISYECEKNSRHTVAKFAQILGILNNNFKQTLVRKFSRIKMYNALDIPILLYGSEISLGP